MINSKTLEIKKYFSSFKIDGYVIPKNDEFFSEFDQFDRLKKVSNFSGSAGLAVITRNLNYLFVDGRYAIQAKNQAGKKFRVLDITSCPPSKIFGDIRLGLDPKIFTRKTIKNLFSKKTKISEIEDNLVDKVINKKTIKNKEFFTLSKSVTGETKNSKINKVVKFLKNGEEDSLYFFATTTMKF